MNRFTTIILSVFALLVLRIAHAHATEQLVLADHGVSEYQLVLPDAAQHPLIDELLMATAQLVQRAFDSNGVELPIVRESTRDSQRPGIYIGRTKAAMDAVDIESLDGWSYVTKTVGSDVIIAGRDVMRADHDDLPPYRPYRRPGARMATIKGVADFLRRYAGVRFLAVGGETGIEFLDTPSIAIPETLDERVNPTLLFSFATRYGRDGVQSLTRDLYLIANNYFPNTFMVSQPPSHSYPSAIPVSTYREAHPEYFAVRGDRRVALEERDTPNMTHYCISNPDVQELLYEGLLRPLDQGFDITLLAQQDGFRACQCRPCFELYDTGADWGEKLWTLHCKLAKRLRQERPGKTMMALAYDRTESPPAAFNTFPDNMMIELCKTTPEVIDQWHACTVPAGYSAYMYLWGRYRLLGFTPKTTPRSIAKLVKRLNTVGVKGFYFDGFGNLFGLEGPSYYVFGRLWDNPDELDAADVLEEYYEAAFREATTPMRRFFDALHHTLEFYNDMPVNRRFYDDVYGRERRYFSKEPLRVIAVLYPPDLLADMNASLRQAETLAASNKVKRRLAVVRLEFDYLNHVARIAHLHNAFQVSPDLASRNRLLDELDRYNRLLDSIFDKNGRPKEDPIPGWPEFTPFSRFKRHDVQAPRRFKGTPLDWDTEEMRQAPLPGAARATAKAVDGPVQLTGLAWDPDDEQRFGSTPDDRRATSARPSLRARYDTKHLYLRIEGESFGDTNAFPTHASGLAADHSASVTIWLAPFDDRDKLYRFRCGPSPTERSEGAFGFITDTLHPLYGKEDPEWSGEWTCRTGIEPETHRRVTLFTIPFATLGAASPQPGTIWRANAARTCTGPNGRTQRTLWSGTSPIGADPGGFGELVFAGATVPDTASTSTPLRQRREALYQRTHKIPPRWKNLTNVLPNPFGPWSFRVDPTDRGVDETWFGPDVDRARWTPIPVPAFWAETSAGDYMGYAWYRTTFELPADWRGQRIQLLFAGVDEQAWIYVNGKKVGEHTVESAGCSINDIWDVPFEIAIASDDLAYGNSNTLVVRVHNSKYNGGIWRPVMIHAP